MERGRAWEGRGQAEAVDGIHPQFLTKRHVGRPTKTRWLIPPVNDRLFGVCNKHVAGEDAIRGSDGGVLGVFVLIADDKALAAVDDGVVLDRRMKDGGVAVEGCDGDSVLQDDGATGVFAQKDRRGILERLEFHCLLVPGLNRLEGVIAQPVPAKR